MRSYYPPFNFPGSVTLPALALLLLPSAAHAVAVPPNPAVPAIPKAAPAPIVGRPAPPFVVPDASGKKRSLAEFKGRPAALFFFCGCSWCSDVAKEWAPLQRSGALRGPNAAREGTPVTLIVYMGDAEAVQTLAATQGLDPAQTVLLPDPEMTLTMETYSAEPCPRVFVLDTKGIIRYINNGKDDQPREAPAMVIVARAMAALRTAGDGEKKSAKQPPKKSKPGDPSPGGEVVGKSQK